MQKKYSENDFKGSLEQDKTKKKKKKVIAHYS